MFSKMWSACKTSGEMRPISLVFDKYTGQFLGDLQGKGRVWVQIMESCFEAM